MASDERLNMPRTMKSFQMLSFPPIRLAQALALLRVVRVERSLQWLLGFEALSC